MKIHLLESFFCLAKKRDIPEKVWRNGLRIEVLTRTSMYEKKSIDCGDWKKWNINVFDRNEIEISLNHTILNGFPLIQNSNTSYFGRYRYYYHLKPNIDTRETIISSVFFFVFVFLKRTMFHIDTWQAPSKRQLLIPWQIFA